MFYSEQTGGFYDPAIHTRIPSDAVEISHEQHAQLLQGQATGKIIAADQNGFPMLAEPAQPTESQKAAAIRSKRNVLLTGSDWAVLPDAPVTEAQRQAWVEYRQALRDITQQPTFPDSVVWPLLPA